MDSGENSSIGTSKCQDLSALKSRKDALFNNKRAENLSNQYPLKSCIDTCKTEARSSARFGALSHHSFFSRHNPHPQRVTHIPGLNGNLVCMVNDDWYVTSPLFPHPLISGRVPRSHRGPLLNQPLCFHQQQQNGSKSGSALLSEAWKEELKDITAKVSMSTQAKKDRGECVQIESNSTPCIRKTQYSAQTGRIIPPPTRATARYSTQASLRHRASSGPPLVQPLQDQELMVLELLCQILQTDSLHLLQQWLLFAGQKEKDMVMGLLQQAMADVSFPRQLCVPSQSGFHRSTSSLPVPLSPPLDRRPTQHTRSRSFKTQESGEDTPDRIGEAEVLQIRQNTAESADTSSLKHSHRSADM